MNTTPDGIVYHPMTPQPGSPQMQQIAEQRFAAMRIHQAVAAGLVPASVLNGHPNTYPALWRMISQKVTPAANSAGFADPAQWLRQGGTQQMPQPGAPPVEAGPPPDVPQDPNALPPPPDVLERYIQSQATGANPAVQSPIAQGMLNQYHTQMVGQRPNHVNEILQRFGPGGMAGAPPSLAGLSPQMLAQLMAMFGATMGPAGNPNMQPYGQSIT